MDIKLVQKYIAGNADDEETQQVMEWIRANDENRREYMAQRKLYDVLLWRTQALEEDGKEIHHHISLRNVWKEAIKIAALVAIVFGATYWWMNYRNTTNENMQSIYAPAGQRTQITLSDGTQVWLNACSRLTYSEVSGRNIRKVKLEGEGYFIVTKDKKRPFIVQTDQYNIKVLGTEFNVSAYPSNKEWRASLLHGKVEILNRNGINQMYLEPNTEATLTNGVLKKGTIERADEFMWREGILCFTNLSIFEMVEKLELYYDVRIIVNNTRMLTKCYTGKFRIGDGIEHVLSVLKLDNKFTYKYDEDNKIITIN